MVWHRQFPLQFLFYLAFDNTHAVPMILDLHGYTVSANAQTHQSGWKHLGQTEELIVVWPEGTVYILGQYDHSRGTSILGEVRNSEISGATH